MQIPDAEQLIAQLAAAMRPHVTPDTALVGIHTGGVWLAQRLHALLGLSQPLGSIDVSFYRDDYGAKGLHPQIKPTSIPFDVEGRSLILVDDVLTTGEAKDAWAQAIDAIKDNLETGLNNIPLGAAGWAEIVSAIRSETARLILEKTATAESKVLQEKADGGHAPSRLLNRLFDGSPQNAEGIHVITTNYDTL